jgi:hypothetical protein
MGRFDAERWSRLYTELFTTHKLVYNRRRILRIEVSAEEDGAFAVVDIETLWRRSDNAEQRWLGRVCKVYALVTGEWKMTAHTRALDDSVVR